MEKADIAARAPRTLPERLRTLPERLPMAKALVRLFAMQVSAAPLRCLSASSELASAVAAVLVFDCDRDEPRVALPRPEVQLVARFGRATRAGLDLHVFGARHTVHRKLIRAGQRSVTVRLRLGASESILGVPGSALAERIVPLEDPDHDLGHKKATAGNSGFRSTNR